MAIKLRHTFQLVSALKVNVHGFIKERKGNERKNNTRFSNYLVGIWFCWNLQGELKAASEVKLNKNLRINVILMKNTH